MKKYALHIDLDDYNESVYHGIYSDLNGCICDSEKYKNLRNDGFEEVDMLHDKDAIIAAFSEKMNRLANVAVPGDFVFITYAGHGGTIEDFNKDEESENDETLVLYDGLWIDDETMIILNKFKSGIIVVWISDSCHSGTNTRFASQFSPNNPESAIKTRGLSSSALREIYEGNKKYYDKEWGLIKN
jgi:hypothetical protein